VRGACSDTQNGLAGRRFIGRLDLTTDRSSVWTLWDGRLVLVLAVLVAPWVALVARKRAAVFAGARRSGLPDVGRLTAIALAGFHRLRCHDQEVHTADHGYPRTRLAKWKGLGGNRASALVRGCASVRTRSTGGQQRLRAAPTKVA
jgi:hypothetical protein